MIFARQSDIRTVDLAVEDRNVTFFSYAQALVSVVSKYAIADVYNTARTINTIVGRIGKQAVVDAALAKVEVKPIRLCIDNLAVFDAKSTPDDIQGIFTRAVYNITAIQMYF
jgi:hypothetical protein